MWDPNEHALAWRAVWAYSRKRYVRDTQTLTLQENRAKAVIDGEKPARKPRFLKADGKKYKLDQAALARARKVAGLKGYVTNIPASLMPAVEVVSSYHDLWHVEQSFRMSKTDLRARPMFHHSREAIEAHLTVVFAALAMARFMQTRAGLSLKKIVTTLKPLQDVVITIAGQEITAQPEIRQETRAMVDSLTL